MIQSFRHKGLQNYFEKGGFSGIQPAHRKRLTLILTMLHAAQEVADMNSPGMNLHRRNGDRREFWSVTLSGNWRVVFRFEEGDAYDVDYLDYH